MLMSSELSHSWYFHVESCYLFIAPKRMTLDGAFELRETKCPSTEQEACNVVMELIAPYKESLNLKHGITLCFKDSKY